MKPTPETPTPEAEHIWGFTREAIEMNLAKQHPKTPTPRPGAGQGVPGLPVSTTAEPCPHCKGTGFYTAYAHCAYCAGSGLNQCGTHPEMDFFAPPAAPPAPAASGPEREGGELLRALGDTVELVGPKSKPLPGLPHQPGRGKEIEMNEARQDEIERIDRDFHLLLRTDPVALAAYQSANAANLSTTQALKFIIVTLGKAKQELESLAIRCAQEHPPLPRFEKERPA